MKELLTTTELAARLQVSETRIRNLARDKIIPRLKFGYRTVRWDYEAVIEALEKYTAKQQMIRYAQREVPSDD